MLTEVGGEEAGGCTREKTTRAGGRVECLVVSGFRCFLNTGGWLIGGGG